jgi:O-antigen/teichoic acid export membrane protein
MTLSPSQQPVTFRPLASVLTRLPYALHMALMVFYRLSSAIGGILVFSICMRNYGAGSVGKYAYTVALCQIIAPLLVGGVDPILVRELVRRPNDRLDLLGSAFLLVFGTTVVTAGIPVVYAWLTESRDPSIFYMALGLSVGLLPNCGLVLMSLFRAESRITLVAVCGLTGVVVCAIVRVALVLLGKPLYYVTAATILEPLLTVVMLLAAYRRRYGSPFAWQVSRESMRTLFELSWPAVLSSFIVNLFFRTTHLMLQALSTFEQLGYYAIAFQMFTVLNFIPNSALAVVYPRLVELHQKSAGRYLESVRTTYVAVTLTGLAICVAVWLWVEPVITLVFGAKSAPAAPVAVAMAVANLFAFSGSVRGQVIYIEHKPIYHVYNTLLGFVALIPLNFVLIPQWGAVGAALSVAAACLVSGVASSWVFPRLRSTGIDQTLAFFAIRRRLVRAPA